MKSNESTAVRLASTQAFACAAAFAMITAAPTALGGAKGTDRPLEGSCSATFAVIGLDPGPPPIQTIFLDLTCDLSHMGATVGGATQRVTLGIPPWNIATTIVYVAANGDELHTAFSGAGFPSPDGTAVAFAGRTDYAGGTGRFANASGWSLDTGSASLITSEGTIAISGAISY